jgi:hypothetical protein
MNRVGALSLYFSWDLFRSLSGLLPPVLTLGFFQATFYFGGNLDYFAGVGGGDMMIVCLATSLLLVHRANRAATYPLLARLPHRYELLCAIVVGTLAITAVMTGLFLALVLGLHKTTVTPPELLIILARWLPLFLLATALGLNMGKLVSRGGSHILTTGVLAALVTMDELQFSVLQDRNFLLDGIHWLASPIATLLSAPVHASSPVAYGMAFLITLAYAAALFVLAAALFQRKDLLWVE